MRNYFLANQYIYKKNMCCYYNEKTEEVEDFLECHYIERYYELVEMLYDNYLQDLNLHDYAEEERRETISDLRYYIKEELEDEFSQRLEEIFIDDNKVKRIKHYIESFLN